ncbi:hypothetical protein GCM10010306_072480 [Streptomyces umbrinus]|nr:hypothetical protein GCM10010306_072480 [Streptomyces umbrinus]
MVTLFFLRKEAHVTPVSWGGWKRAFDLTDGQAQNRAGRGRITAPGASTAV